MHVYVQDVTSCVLFVDDNKPKTAPTASLGIFDPLKPAATQPTTPGMWTILCVTILSKYFVVVLFHSYFSAKFCFSSLLSAGGIN